MSNTLKSLNVRIGADITDLERKMKRAAATVRREGRNLSNLGNELSLAVSLPLAGIGISALKSAGELEQLRLALETTMTDGGRSIEEARTELDLLRKAALAPGLDFEQAVKASIRLQNVGMSAENARTTIEELANAITMSGGTAEDLDGVTIQMAQMISKGKVLASDLRIIQERMPKITSLMQEAFGVKTADQLQELGVSGEEFVAKITEKMKGLTRVQGGLSNAFVNFGQSLRLTLAKVGEDIDKTFDVKGNLERFAGTISDLSDRFSNLSDGTKKTILTTAALAVASGPVIKAFGVLKMTYASVIDAMRSMVDVAKNMSSALIGAAAKFQAMDKVMKATTIGLVVAGIAAAVLIFKQLNDQMSQAEKVQATLNDVQVEAAKNIAAEKLEAERLTGILNDENETRERKEAALKRLKEINSTYFGDLDLEKIKIEENNKALNNYINAIERRAKLAAANEKLIEIEKKLLDVGEQIENATPDVFSWQNLADVATSGGNALNYLGNRIQTVNKNLEENRSALEAQKKALLDMLNASDAPIAGTGGGSQNFTRNTKGDKGKKEKEQKDVLAELGKQYEIIAGQAAIYGTAMDANSARANALKGAIDDLLEQGVKPQDERLQMLAERYRNLTTELSYLPAQFSVTRDAVIEASTQINEAMSNTADKTSMAFQSMGDVLMSAMAAAAQAFYDGAAAGEMSFNKLGKSALKAARDIVRAALMSFVSNVIKDTGIVSGPLAPILAPAAGAAAGLAFNGILNALKIPALAEGAVVTKPTLALIGEAGPEIVAPPQKLPGLATMMGMENRNKTGNQQLVAKISGRDIYFLLEDVGTDVKRTRGY